jgi:hypothetical protein
MSSVALVTMEYSQERTEPRPSKLDGPQNWTVLARRAQQRLLQCVFGVVQRSEHPPRMASQFGQMRLDQLAERPLGTWELGSRSPLALYT